LIHYKQAQDYKYSSVAPVINQNNQLIQPEKVGQQWQLNGIQITLIHSHNAVRSNSSKMVSKWVGV
jgi:hypothetical protein